MALADSSNIIAVSVVFSALAILAVVARFIARRLQGARFRADDYLIIPGLAFAVGLGANNIVCAVLGNPGHNVPPNELEDPAVQRSLVIYKQSDFATQLISLLALTFVKLSIVCFYRRIFRNRTLSVITTILIVLIITWGIAFFLATLLQCVPVKAVWDLQNGEPGHVAKCYNPIPMFYGTAISNLIMDIIILSIPIPMVWRLQMPPKQKIAVTSIFLLGAFVVGISIARVYFFFEAGAQITKAQAEPSTNQDERAPATLYWTQLESAIAVVCACLPTLRVLFGKVSLERAIKSFASRLSILSPSKTSLRSIRNRASFRSLRRTTRSGQEGGSAFRKQSGSADEAVPLPSLDSTREKQWKTEAVTAKSLQEAKPSE